jgi:hypothetical protein
MLGCQAALAIEPTADPMATLDPGGPAPEGTALDLVQVEEADPGTYDIGPGADLPTTIEPGTYRIVGEWNLMSDVPSAGTVPIMGTQHGCVAPLTVGTTTTRVSISLVFALDGTCVVTAAAG